VSVGVFLYNISLRNHSPLFADKYAIKTSKNIMCCYSRSRM